MLLCQLVDRIHIADQSRLVYDQNCSRPVRNALFNRLRAYINRAGLGIREDRDVILKAKALNSSKVRDGTDDDFVSRLEAKRRSQGRKR